jgi:hypothetical protein
MARSKGRWVLLILVLFFVFLVVVSATMSRVKQGSVLVVELGGSVAEPTPPTPAGSLEPPKPLR